MKKLILIVAALAACGDGSDESVLEPLAVEEGAQWVAGAFCDRGIECDLVSGEGDGYQVCYYTNMEILCRYYLDCSAIADESQARLFTDCEIDISSLGCETDADLPDSCNELLGL